MLRSCLAQVKFPRLVPNRGMTSEAFPQNISANTLWEGVDLPNEPLERLTLSQEPRPDPSIDSSFKLGTAAQVSHLVSLLLDCFELMKAILGML